MRICMQVDVHLASKLRYVFYGWSDVHYWSPQLISTNRNKNDCMDLMKYKYICISNNTHKTHKYIYLSILIPLKKDLSDMVTLLKFLDVKDSFQRKLNEHIRKIKGSLNAIGFADKINNIYTKCHKTITRDFYIIMLPKLIQGHTQTRSFN